MSKRHLFTFFGCKITAKIGKNKTNGNFFAIFLSFFFLFSDFCC